MQLILDTAGLTLTTNKGAFQVLKGTQQRRIAPSRVSSIAITSHCIVHTQALELAAKSEIPVILFTKNGGQWLENIAATGTDAVGLDWTTDIAEARARIGDRVALQGNLDPCVLYAGKEVIEREVAAVLAGFGQGSGHVFNLGHGIHQFVDPEHPKYLIDAVHELSRPYHEEQFDDLDALNDLETLDR